MYPKIPLTFQVGHSPDPDHIPEHWVKATVPGAVQLDWAKAHDWPPIEYQAYYNVRYAERNVPIAVDYEWMEDVYWRYQARLDFDTPTPEQRIYFVAQVDYQCQIFINQRLIHSQEGMFTPIEIDITAQAQPDDLLEILVHPVPKMYHRPVDEKQAMQSCKPAFSYGWDYHLRLIPLGIWEGGHLEIRPACHLKRAEVFYQLDDNLSLADLRLEVDLSQSGLANLRWTIVDWQGKPVLQEIASTDGNRQLTAQLEAPDLWWPNGQGQQHLYTSTVELYNEAGKVVDTFQQRIGFRRIRLVPYDGSWHDPDNAGFPNSRNKPPITLEVNGRRIFGKGANWVGPDIFPGRITTETYQPLLQAAHKANFNLLRCWGGAPVQKEAFFNLCDELGIMIWQEFPLSCGNYLGTPAYLQILDQESKTIIQRLRKHPCLALWSGGNELFNAWSGMTDQDLALRLLNRNTYDLDPQRPFIPTSPLMGMAHGGYQFRLSNGDEVFQYFPRARNTAYTEFGVPGPTSAELLRRIIPADELFPPRRGTHWQARHAFSAWDGSPDSWLELWCIEHYFGKAENIEQLVEWGQWLQAEGLKFIYEEARRQKPRCAMALNWCFNEPWPNAANNSLLSWPAELKPALKAVGEALRSILVSARPSKFSWQSGDVFHIEIYLLNDSPQFVSSGEIDVYLLNGHNEFHLLTWKHPDGSANTNIVGPEHDFVLPILQPGPLNLVLRSTENPNWDSCYKLLASG